MIDLAVAWLVTPAGIRLTTSLFFAAVVTWWVGYIYDEWDKAGRP